MPCSTMVRSGTSSGQPNTPSATLLPRADLEGHPRLGDALEHPRVLDAAHPVADAVRAQRVEGRLDRGGAEQLAGVGHERQAGPPGDLERRGEVRGRAAALVVAQPEPDDRPGALTGVLGREPGQGAGVERVPDPARGHDDGDLRPRPVAAGSEAARASSRTISRAGVMPPTNGA